VKWVEERARLKVVERFDDEMVVMMND